MSAPDSPPPLPDVEAKPATSGLAIVLSLILLLFLGSAVVAFMDNTLILLLYRQNLSAANGVLGALMLFVGFLTYGLMAFAPAIPKRFFLPISLFFPVVYIGVLPLLIYFYQQNLWIAWAISVCQVLLGAFILLRAQGGPRLHWPLIPASCLNDRRFSWGNLALVVLAGVFVIFPALVLYTGFSAQLAVHHFSDGFVALRPSGISMQVRKYIRDDGRKITLVPMSHVGESKFYQDLAASFPDDSVVLMEGVSDKESVMASHLDYSKMASVVGGVQQVTTFKPRGEIVAADVDVSSFSAATLEMLRNAMLVHAKGLTPETLPILMKPTPPGLERQLMYDLLTMRNRHLLEVLQDRLQNSGNIIVPWGAAHMPGISREIQKSGFHMVEKQEYVAIRFGS